MKQTMTLLLPEHDDNADDDDDASDAVEADD